MIQIGITIHAWEHTNITTNDSKYTIEVEGDNTDILNSHVLVGILSHTSFHNHPLQLAQTTVYSLLHTQFIPQEWSRFSSILTLVTRVLILYYPQIAPLLQSQLSSMSSILWYTNSLILHPISNISWDLHDFCGRCCSPSSLLTSFYLESPSLCPVCVKH